MIQLIIAAIGLGAPFAVYAWMAVELKYDLYKQHKMDEIVCTSKIETVKEQINAETSRQIQEFLRAGAANSAVPDDVVQLCAKSKACREHSKK